MRTRSLLPLTLLFVVFGCKHNEDARSPSDLEAEAPAEDTAKPAAGTPEPGATGTTETPGATGTTEAPRAPSAARLVQVECAHPGPARTGPGHTGTQHKGWVTSAPEGATC